MDTVYLNKPFKNEYLSFLMLGDYSSVSADEDIYFEVNNLFQLTNKYIEKLNIKTSTIESSIIEVVIDGTTIQKEKDFVNQLCSNQINWGLGQKNDVAKTTVKFIDDQLKEFSDSLSGAEANLEKLRTGEKFVDIDFHSKKTYEFLQSLEEEEVLLKVKHKYYTYLEEYITSNQALDKLVAPSTIGINDLLLNNLVGDINKLNSEKAALSYGVKNSSPSYSSIDLKLENSKRTLLENIKNIIKSSEIALAENQRRINEANSLLSKLPKTERTLLNIKRKFNHNDLMFNYLMQKRAAASIAEASSVSDSRILDSAILDKNDPIFPNKYFVLGFAFLMGLLLPGLGIILSESLNNKVRLREDIVNYSGMKVIGTLPLINKKIKELLYEKDTLVKEYSNMLRNNIKNCAPQAKVIGVSSVSANEGKSMVGILLADSFVRNGKKVLLMEMNFRTPSIQQHLELTKVATLVDYFESNLSPAEVTHAAYKNGFDVMVTASANGKQEEYIISDKFNQLFKYAQDNFDVIIIDGTNSGLVSDYHSLVNSIDLNLFVVRNNYTTYSDLMKIKEFNECKSFENSYAVLNGYNNFHQN